MARDETIGCEPYIADLAKMPHLLIAGTTGAGKSVGVNAMILSILYRLPPDQCRMIMIDPKMLELSVYDGIPHLLAPVVTDPKKAIVALKWTVREMEDRYRRMSKIGVRNVASYNERAREALSKGEHFERTVQTGFDDGGRPIFESEKIRPEPMPYLVVIIDEVTAGADEEGEDGDLGLGGGEESNDLYDRAVAVVTRDGKASTSYIQRRLQIGYNRAASLMERMEQDGVVGPANHAGKREILLPEEEGRF